MNLCSRSESDQQHWLMGMNACKIRVFSSKCHLRTQDARRQWRKKSKIQGSKSHGKQKKQQGDTKDAEAGASTDELKLSC